MNINHILIQTNNLSNMTRFFENVVGLEVGDRPPFPFPGVWMYHEYKPLIHLVEAQANSSQSDYLGTRSLSAGGAVDHIAFEGDDYAELIARLDATQLDYTQRTVPLSKEHQVFVAGPEGVTLEILFTQHKQSLTHS